MSDSMQNSLHTTNIAHSIQCDGSKHRSDHLYIRNADIFQCLRLCPIDYMVLKNVRSPRLTHRRRRCLSDSPIAIIWHRCSCVFFSFSELEFIHHRFYKQFKRNTTVYIFVFNIFVDSPVVFSTPIILLSFNELPGQPVLTRVPICFYCRQF